MNKENLHTEEVRTIRKTGSSLALTLPSFWVRTNNIKAGDSVKVTMDGDKMTICPITI